MIRFLIIAMVLILNTSCVSSKKIYSSPLEMSNEVFLIKDWLAKKKSPIGKEISLAEAINRALKYNLELEQARYRFIIEEKSLASSLFGGIPGGIVRVNTYSRNNEGGFQNSSSASSRQNLTSQVAVTWSLSEIKQAQLRSRQIGNKLIIEKNIQQQVANRIIQEVLNFYLQVAKMTPIINKISKIEKEMSKYIEYSQKGSEGLQDPLISLRYQENLLTLLMRIKQFKHQYLLSKQRLAFLIGATNTSFSIPESIPPLPVFKMKNFPLSKLENYALLNKPELKEAIYKLRNAEIDEKITKHRLTPLPQLEVSYNFDAEKNLENNQWAQVALNFSTDLLRLNVKPILLEEQFYRTELEKSSVLGLASYLLHDIRNTYLQLENSYKQWEMSQERSKLRERIYVINEKLIEVNPDNQLSYFAAKIEKNIYEFEDMMLFLDYLSYQFYLMHQIGLGFDFNKDELREPEYLKNNIEEWLIKLPFHLRKMEDNMNILDKELSANNAR